MSNIKKKVMKNLVKNLGTIMLVAALMLPVLSMADDKDIYVDADASGKQTGSSSHPYKKIGDAIDDAKNEDEDVNIHVASGTYKENIEVPGDVKIFGSDKDKVIIKGDDDEAVVKLKHDTEINKVTIKGGKYGVKINDGDRASIVDCVIKDNDKDGVKIEAAPIKNDKYIASITDSKIYDNGGSGIYSEKRQLSIINNEIIENDGDGVDIEGGSSAWIYKNDIKDNNKTGLKLTLDGSNIWVKNNTLRDNEREGIEVNAFGGYGRIDVNKTKLYQNERYGIARVQRGSFASSVWDGLTIQEDSKFWENVIGSLSSIISL